VRQKIRFGPIKSTWGRVVGYQPRRICSLVDDRITRMRLVDNVAWTYKEPQALSKGIYLRHMCFH